MKEDLIARFSRIPYTARSFSPMDTVYSSDQFNEVVTEALEEIEKINAKFSWVSVKDRLPDDGDLVLIATVSGNVTDYNFAKWSGEYWTRKAWPLGYAPTHWMPLPEPPK